MWRYVPLLEHITLACVKPAASALVRVIFIQYRPLYYVEVFAELLHGHIALEETLIYPESKARWAQAVAQRRAKTGT